MLGKLKYSILALSIMAIAGCNKNQVVVEKTPISENHAETKKGFSFSGQKFIFNESHIAEINKLNKDLKVFDKFYKLNFNQVDSIQKFQFDLSEKGKALENVESSKRRILHAIKNVREEKRIIAEKEINELLNHKKIAERELNAFLKETERYMTKIKPVLEKKKALEKELEVSKNNIKEYSKSLSKKINSYFNDNNVEMKIKEDHFEKIMSAKQCEEDFSVKSKSVKFFSNVNDFCYLTYVPVEQKHSQLITSNLELMTEIKVVFESILEEYLKQGAIDGGDGYNLNTRINAINKSLDQAYEKTERTHHVTRYQLEGKRKNLEKIIEEKNDIYLREKRHIETRIDSKMRTVNLNTFKNIMKENELNYIKELQNKIIGNPINSERDSFELVKYELNGNNEVLLTIDSFQAHGSNFEDVVIIDPINIKNDVNFMNQIKGKKVPIDLAIQAEYAYRYQGKSIENMTNVLNNAKALLQN